MTTEKNPSLDGIMRTLGRIAEKVMRENLDNRSKGIRRKRDPILHVRDVFESTGMNPGEFQTMIVDRGEWVGDSLEFEEFWWEEVDGKIKVHHTGRIATRIITAVKRYKDDEESVLVTTEFQGVRYEPRESRLDGRDQKTNKTLPNDTE